MSVVVLCSAHGAPGVTTSALALAWVWPAARPGRRVLLVDGDPAGSGLLTGYLSGGVPRDAGVSILAAGRPPLSADQLVGCCVALDADATRMVLPGVLDPVQARPLAPMWGSLLSAARDLSDQGVDVLVDAGRVGHHHEPRVLVTEADLVAVVVRGDVSSVAPSAAAVRALMAERKGRHAPVALVVDASGYSSGQIRAALGVTEVLSLVRDDWTAHQFALGATSGWRFERSPLLRAAHATAARIADLVPERTAVTS
ncbi:hypothetical protein ACPPVS_12640 [Cellulomonas sp. McL0617]|uniref:hypothetical protein n=1 Tax=Cellulomonas sp. McL0617 TaxID=3415675 RepID=UPI003CF39199